MNCAVSSKTSKSTNLESCLDFDSLIEIAKAYNNFAEICDIKRCIKVSPINIPINVEIFEELYIALKSRLSALCTSEYCWADLEFINSIKDPKIKQQIQHFTFKPSKPVSLLSTTDINSVIQQYVRLVPDLKYMGALPSNIFNKAAGGIKFNWSKLKQKYNNIAIVFNNDPIGKPGSHWVAAWITHDTIEFFDSLGKPPNKNISKFFKSLGKKLNLVYNKFVHQRGGILCGVYVCYFIIQKIHNKTFNEINANHITHGIISKYKTEIFRTS